MRIETNEVVLLDIDAIARRWWTLVLRGLAAITFGVLTLAAPRISLFSLVIIWAAYAFADGVFALLFAARGAREHRPWGWLLFEGLVGIGAAIATVAWPNITALVLLVTIGVWAIMTGVAEIAAAIELRRVIRHEWLLGLSGLLSIAFGAFVLVSPSAGALAVLWMIGTYAVVFGVVLVALGFRLHRFVGSWTPKHA
jgi:uncharacterized membrane protein HdeD (DUF308 family)